MNTIALSMALLVGQAEAPLPPVEPHHIKQRSFWKRWVPAINHIVNGNFMEIARMGEKAFDTRVQLEEANLRIKELEAYNRELRAYLDDLTVWLNKHARNTGRRH